MGSHHSSHHRSNQHRNHHHSRSHHHHNNNHQHHHHHNTRRSYHNILEHGNDLLHEALHHGRRLPKPFEPEETDVPDGFITAKLFHNYFYDGFYAPYIFDPNYMFLIDCRDEDSYNRRHVLTAHWHGSFDVEDLVSELNMFSLIILYDEEGTSSEASVMRKLQRRLLDLDGKLEPVIIVGGFAAIEKNYPYMLSKVELTTAQRPTSIQWYPSIIEDDTLYLGRAEHSVSLNVIESLGITHVVNLTPNTPNLYSTVSYLSFPISDCKDGLLANYFLEIAKRIEGVVEAGGRVLIHCDHGVNAGAAVVIAYLMYTKICTLEDAHYCVKSLRPIIQPNEYFLEQLSCFEHDFFGRRFTNTDDLWF